MIVPDVNVLLYVLDSDAALHPSASDWWESVVSGPELIGIADVVDLAVVRLTTNRRIFPGALTPQDAFSAVAAWHDLPRVRRLAPGPRHRSIWRDLVVGRGVGGNLVNDAFLAALAIEHDATLVSYDTDFAIFPGLRWTTPAE